MYKVILLWWGDTLGFFFTLRGPVFSWDSPIFAYLTSFYRINDARHLWSNLQKCEFSFWEKEYDCNKCKTTFKNFFHDYGCFLMPFRHFWMNWCCAPSVIQYAKKKLNVHVVNLWFFFQHFLIFFFDFFCIRPLF